MMMVFLFFLLSVYFSKPSTVSAKIFTHQSLENQICTTCVPNMGWLYQSAKKYANDIDRFGNWQDTCQAYQNWNYTRAADT